MQSSKAFGVALKRKISEILSGVIAGVICGLLGGGIVVILRHEASIVLFMFRVLNDYT